MPVEVQAGVPAHYHWTQRSCWGSRECRAEGQAGAWSSQTCPPTPPINTIPSQQCHSSHALPSSRMLESAGVGHGHPPVPALREGHAANAAHGSGAQDSEQPMSTHGMPPALHPWHSAGAAIFRRQGSCRAPQPCPNSPQPRRPAATSLEPMRSQQHIQLMPS